MWSRPLTIWSAIDSRAHNVKVCDDHVREITQRLERDIGAGKVESANGRKPVEAPDRGNLSIITMHE